MIHHFLELSGEDVSYEGWNVVLGPLSQEILFVYFIPYTLGSIELD